MKDSTGHFIITFVKSHRVLVLLFCAIWVMNIYLCIPGATLPRGKGSIHSHVEPAFPWLGFIVGTVFAVFLVALYRDTKQRILSVRTEEGEELGSGNGESEK